MAQKTKRNSIATMVKRDVAAAAIASGASLKVAAAEAGVGRRTMTRWVNDDEEFKRKVESEAKSRLAKIREYALDQGLDVMRALVAAALDGDVRAQCAVLDRIGVHRVERLEHGGATPGAGITINITPDEAERAERLAKKVTG